MKNATPLKSVHIHGLILVLVIGLFGCGPSKIKQHMRATGYCGCGECCGWERGSWKFLKLDFWNKYISKGAHEGEAYSGLTASGTKPHEPRHGLFSFDSVIHPWMLPFRIIFPWLWFSRDGTIAADTQYYPFGTRMFVPEYGYGIVEDRGSAITGPKHIDLFFDSHSEALDWGNQYIDVDIYK